MHPGLAVTSMSPKLALQLPVAGQHQLQQSKGRSGGGCHTEDGVSSAPIGPPLIGLIIRALVPLKSAH